MARTTRDTQLDSLRQSVLHSGHSLHDLRLRPGGGALNDLLSHCISGSFNLKKIMSQNSLSAAHELVFKGSGAGGPFHYRERTQRSAFDGQIVNVGQMKSVKHHNCTHIIGNGEFMSTGLVTGIQTCCCTRGRTRGERRGGGG